MVGLDEVEGVKESASYVDVLKDIFIKIEQTGQKNTMQQLEDWWSYRHWSSSMGEALKKSCFFWLLAVASAEKPLKMDG